MTHIEKPILRDGGEIVNVISKRRFEAACEDTSIFDEHDPLTWTDEATAGLAACIAATPATHPDYARLMGKEGGK